MDLKDFYTLYKNCNKVTIDSRKIEPGDVFFAFSGDNFNAATLADQAVEQGALAVIVEQKEYENTAKNIIYKPSTLSFLQQLATFHRLQLKIPIIGLTGSNGKTTSKELITAVLSEKYKVQSTVGNLNNHIGVPLTLLSIKLEHQVAVVEMGANHQKEIDLLCSMARPDYGYITNFGKAHLEGFGGFEGVIKGKSELYDYLYRDGKTVVINEKDPIQTEKTIKFRNKITFGQPQSDYYFELFSKDHFVGLKYKNQTAASKLTGDYNFTNLCAASALGLHFGISFEKIKKAIEQYVPTNMRSQIVERNGKTLVVDTYNANPSSMAASLNNFNAFEGSKSIIIGDMLELGYESRKEHEDILQLARALDFSQIITVGEHFAEINDSYAFKNTEELSSYLKIHPIASKNVLLKGSRGVALEKVLDLI